MIKIVVVEFEPKKQKKNKKNGQRAVVFGHGI